MRILELEGEDSEDSDIVVTMVATAMDSYKKDETNISIKINSYEYFNSAKIPMEFKIYHPITNNYLLRTSESIQSIQRGALSCFPVILKALIGSKLPISHL